MCLSKRSEPNDRCYAVATYYMYYTYWHSPIISTNLTVYTEASY